MKKVFIGVLSAIWILYPIFAFAGGVIQPGITVDGSRDDSGVESWSFQAIAGQRVVINASVTSGNIYGNYLELYYSGDSKAEASGNGSIDCQLSRSGQYTIVVGSWFGSAGGTYDLTLELLSLTAQSIYPNQSLDGTLAGGSSMQLYTFQGTAGQRIILNAVVTSGNIWDDNMRLYYSDGSGPEASGIGSLDHQLAKTGQYTIVVGNYYGSTGGTYNITLEILPLTAQPITPGQSIDGTLPAGSSMQLYTFQGTAGQRIILNAVVTSGSIWGGEMRLYCSDGSGPEASGIGSLDHQLAKTGQYTIVVGNYYGSTGGTYNITLEILPLTAQPITPGQSIDGTLPAGSSMQLYTFQGTAGQRIILNAVVTSGNIFGGDMHLYYSDGSDTEASGIGSLDHQLAKTGQYTVVVGNYYGSTGDTFNITLNVIEPISILNTKQQVDGTIVNLAAKAVTAVLSDAIYIEEDSRICGIRITGLSQTWNIGDRINVMGTISTNSDGERFIAGRESSPNGNGNISPLITLNRNVGGGDFPYNSSSNVYQVGVKDGYGVNNIGLLVTTFGKITSIGTDSVYIDDSTHLDDGTGNGTGIRVVCSPSGYSVGDYLFVSGVVSCFKSTSGDIIRRVLTREGSDVFNPDFQYTGHWKGNWQDITGDNQNGTMDIIVDNKGNISGTVTDISLSLTSPATGLIDNAGQFNIAYSWGSYPYTDSGIVAIDNSTKHATGTLNVYSYSELIDTTTCDLIKQ